MNVQETCSRAVAGAGAQIDRARRHPATNTGWFRWWLAVPIVVALAFAYRDALHHVFHFVFRIAETPGGHAPHAADAMPAVRKMASVVDWGVNFGAKAVTLGTAAGWVAVRSKPKEPKPE